MDSSINYPVSTDTSVEKTASRGDADAVLAREAGVPFRPQSGTTSGVDPFAQWLSLMEVVQMLCPVLPVCDNTMQGNYCRL